MFEQRRLYIYLNNFFSKRKSETTIFESKQTKTKNAKNNSRNKSHWIKFYENYIQITPMERPANHNSTLSKLEILLLFGKKIAQLLKIN